jgi:hypothetical protein
MMGGLPLAATSSSSSPTRPATAASSTPAARSCVSQGTCSTGQPATAGSPTSAPTSSSTCGTSSACATPTSSPTTTAARTTPACCGSTRASPRRWSSRPSCAPACSRRRLPARARHRLDRLRPPPRPQPQPAPRAQLRRVDQGLQARPSHGNTVVSYYEKGYLLGVCLDLELRLRSASTARGSLTGLFRRLMASHGARGKGITHADIVAAASAEAGEPMDAFFARHVDGTAELPLPELLARSACASPARPPAGPQRPGPRGRAHHQKHRARLPAAPPA